MDRGFPHRQKTPSGGERQPIIIWADVTSGIPQGSVLGPMLFIIYINDMPSSVVSSIYLFADDANVYRNISSNDDPPILQHDLQQLEKWSAKWQLRLTQTSVRSCTSVNKTPVKTTPWAEQRWLLQPARRKNKLYLSMAW